MMKKPLMGIGMTMASTIKTSIYLCISSDGVATKEMAWGLYLDASQRQRLINNVYSAIEAIRGELVE